MSLCTQLHVQAPNPEHAAHYTEEAISRSAVPAHVMNVRQYHGDNPMGCMWTVGIEADVQSEPDMFEIACRISTKGRGLIRIGGLFDD